jgi:hypothetical protein
MFFPSVPKEKEKSQVPDMGSMEGVVCGHRFLHGQSNEQELCCSGQTNLKCTASGVIFSAEHLNRNDGSQFHPWERIHNAQFSSTKQSARTAD